jgi:hypothetical protein
MNQSSGRLLGLVPESFKKVVAFIVFSVVEEHNRFFKAAIVPGIIIFFHSRKSI